MKPPGLQLKVRNVIGGGEQEWATVELVAVAECKSGESFFFCLSLSSLLFPPVRNPCFDSCWCSLSLPTDPKKDRRADDTDRTEIRQHVRLVHAL